MRTMWLLLAPFAILSCSTDGGSSNSFSEFEEAVGRNDVPAVVDMLRAGQDPDEYPVLISAARSGHAETIAALLAGGADPNITVAGRSETPLHAAATRQDPDAPVVMSMLLEAGGDPCTRVDLDEPDYASGVPMNYGGLSVVEIADTVGFSEVIAVLSLDSVSCDD